VSAQWPPSGYRGGSADDLRAWQWQRLGAINERSSWINWLWALIGLGVWVGYMTVSWDGYGVSNFLLGLLFVGLVSLPFILWTESIGRQKKHLLADLEGNGAQ
jgi:hypothetical protein